VSRSRLALAVVIVVLVAAFFAAGGQRYLSFDNIKAQQAAILGDKPFVWDKRGGDWQRISWRAAAKSIILGPRFPIA